MKDFLEWQRVIHQFQALKLIFLHAIKAMWPLAYEPKSPGGFEHVPLDPKGVEVEFGFSASFFSISLNKNKIN